MLGFSARFRRHRSGRRAPVVSYVDPGRYGRLRRPVAALVPPVLVLAVVSVASVAAQTAAASQADAATAGCTPDGSYTNCQVITYSGADQTFTAPSNVTSVLVKSWGAGGGGVDSSYYTANAGGGGGGFASGTLTVTPGQQLNVVVGQGGKQGSASGGSTSPTYGGGGAGGTNATGIGSAISNGSSGGGLSGVFTSSTHSAASAVIVAGGGGGASPGADTNSPGSGGGGGATGGQDSLPELSGRGGTQTAGGAGATVSTGCASVPGAGTQFQGGAGSSTQGTVGTAAGEGGGGGGGGWYGGGGGKCQNTASTPPNGPGGGGSSYISAAALSAGSTTAGGNGAYGTPGTVGAAANTSDPQYVNGVGTGGTTTVAGGGTGGNGLVVIEWNLGYTITKSASPASVAPGGKETYTLAVTNTGQNALTAASPAGFTDNLAGVLDDATYNNDAASTVAGWTFAAGSTSLTGSGPLAIGQTTTITYSVTVNQSATSSNTLVNTVAPASSAGTCGANCSTSTPLITPQTSCPTPITIKNGSFEAPVIGNGSFTYINQTNSAIAWKTTATDGQIELWRPNSAGAGSFNNNGAPIFAEDGSQFAELNATQVGALYQDIATTPGQVMHWSLWHRGRTVAGANGIDTMQVQIGVPGGTVVPQNPDGQTSANIVDGPTKWVQYTGTYTVPAGQTTTRFQFAAISTSSGNNSAGNFLDNIVFSNSPCFLTTKSVANTTASSGTLTQPGDTLQYTVAVKNGGGGASSNSVVSDQIPANTTYVPGSLTVDGNGVTDASGDDTGSYSSSGNAVTVNLGTGASATAGGSLAAGQTSTITFQVKVNSGVAAGTSIPNAANTSYTWPPSTASIAGVSNTVTNTVSTSSITLAKSVGSTTDVNGNGRLDPGDKINYNFLVTNTGSVALSGVAVNDDTAGTVSCPSGTLAAGANETCTASYTVTDADGTAGKVVNTATASGTPPSGAARITSASSSVTTPIVAASIGITKTPASNTVAAVGDVSTYTLKVTNTGSVRLTGVSASDVFAAPAGAASSLSCSTAQPATLAAGASYTCTVTYSTTQADLDNGSIRDTASVVGTPPAGSAVTASANATVTATQRPSLTLLKTASPTVIVGSGKPIAYSFLVTNNGNVTVSGLTVADTFTAPAGPAPATTCPSTTLAPGASTTCTATYTATQADVDAGSIANSAVASGQTAAGAAVSSPASAATVTATPGPSLSVTKTPSTTSVSAVGQNTSYTITVKNTGNVTLSNVSTTDALAAPAGPNPAISCSQTQPLTLAVNASYSCTVNYATTQADLDNGSIRDTATATGLTPKGATVTGSGSATVTTTQSPALSVVKSANPTTVTASGQAIAYSFVVTNTGNVTVSSVGVADTLAAPAAPTPTVSCPATTLAPGTSTTCTATYTATTADVDSGSISDSAVATGKSPTATTVTSAPSTATVTASQTPGLTLTKTANPTSVSGAGQKVTYSFGVTNSGNVTASNIAISDTFTAPAGPVPAITCAATSLIPGASTTCTSAAYTVTTADADAGSVKNSAVATASSPSGTAITSNTATATVTVPRNASLTLVKSAARPSVSAAGQVINYSFAIKNTGNVTVTALSVADTFTAPAGPAPTITCSATSLAAGGSTTCTASYTTTQADVDAGSVVNTATVSGKDPGGVTVTSAASTATVGVVQGPALSVTKTASPTTVTAAGQTVNYSVAVTNTGNVSVSGIGVVDTFTAPAGPVPTFTCPSTTLAPGASTTCTAPYTVLQADIDAGSIKNSATATGRTANGTAVTSAASTATVTVTQTARLTLVKSASTANVSGPGQTVTYSFLVTNTGNVTASNLSIADTLTKAAGAVPTITCPATTLAPGASTTCTGAYTVVQGDIDSGSISDSAVANATGPTGAAIASPASAATVAANQTLSLTLAKTASRTTVTAVGQQVTYSFLVTNSGNLAVSGLAINDTFTAPAGPALSISCPTTSLNPGASTTCTGVYTTTAADLDAGTIVNSATASATGSNQAAVTSSPSTATVTATQTPGLTVVKTATPTTVTAAGQTVSYTFAVTNTGNVTVTNINVADTFTAPAGPVPAISCPSTSLAAGGTENCTATYTAKQADIDAGSIKNSAVVSGKDPKGNTVTSVASTATVAVTQTSKLTLTKSASPATATAAGQTITYFFAVLNAGNVTVSGLSVADTFTAPAGPALSISCPATSVAPGATVTCSAPYTVTQADVDAGSIANSASAAGTNPAGGTVASNTSTAAVSISRAPALTLTETAAPTTVTAVGQSVTYSYTVKNSGNVSVTGLGVVDTESRTGSTSPTVTCQATALAPGASTTCTATYVTTQADLDKGSIVDSAVASARAPGTVTVTSNTTGTTVTATGTAALTVVKTVSPTTVTAANSTVVYSVKVTNTGSLTVSNIAINDTFTAPAAPVPTFACPATSLAPGVSTTCTASYTVTQADVDKGSIVNSATASGTDPFAKAVTSAASTATVTIAPAPNLTLTKTATPTTVATAGTAVTYRFAVKNTGNVTVTNLAVADTLTAPASPALTVSCPVTTLAPGATTTCTAPYTVLQTDVDFGSINNSAKVTGKTPAGLTTTSNTSTATVSATAAPALTLVKTASPTTITAAGQQVSYSFKATNTGNVTLTALSIADTFTSPAAPVPTITCPATTLAPGASTTCTGLYSATQADVDKGSIVNSATASANSLTGTVVTSAASTATVTVTRSPKLTVQKTASPTSVSSVGTVVSYSIVVRNAGNVTISGIAVSDAMTAPAGPSPTVNCPETSLAPGASTTCTASYTVTQADLTNGVINNTAGATGTAPGTTTVTAAPSTATVAVVQTPQLSLTKSVSPTVITTLNQQLTYTFGVTNAGNVPLTGLSIADTFTAPAGPALNPITCTATNLDAGASTTCTATYRVTQADLDNGSVVNSAVASAKDPNNATVTSPASVATATVTASPKLTVVKSASPTTVSAAGQTVAYSIVATNGGNVTLSGLSIADSFTAPAGPAVTVACPTTTLAPASSTTCTASYPVTQPDVNAGSITNSATGSAKDPSGTAVSSAVSSATVAVAQAPALTLTETASPTRVTAAGQTVSYTFGVKNTGNTTVTGVKIAETFTAPGGPVPTITCQSTTLLPGSSTTCTSTYTATQADVDHGSIVDSATATGLDPKSAAVTSNTTTTTVTAPAAGKLTLVKSASPTSVSANGDKVTYSFVASNTGNVTLTGITVTDTMTAPAAPSPTVSCPNATLLPGSSETCTATYTVTQPDIDAGSVTNSATVAGTTPGGTTVTSPASTATVTVAQGPALTVVKSASPSTISAAGQTVNYSFLVTNSGNQTVSGISISDTFTAPAGPVPAITCPATSLAPGASTTCTAPYTATQSDVDNGSIKNTATALGTAPGNVAVTSAASAATVGVTQSPSLTVVKTASAPTGAGVGSTVQFGFLATNTGNVTLSLLSIQDSLAAPAGPAVAVTCPVRTIAPNSSASCTASYTITQADVDSGSVSNTATASASTPGGATVTSPGSGATVAITRTPQLTITTSPSPASVNAVGQQVTFTFTVTNSGNTRVGGIAVTDAFVAPAGPGSAITCAATSLVPGASTTCTQTYVTTQQDLDAGSIATTPTVTGVGPGGTGRLTAAGAQSTVPVTVSPVLTLTKTANPLRANNAGDVITYTFGVGNGGNVTLSGLTIADTFAGTAGPGSTINCAATTLAPGATTTCSSTYAVTQDDVAAGTVDNTATASAATPLAATVTSAPASATVSVNQQSALQLTNTPNPTTVSTVGQTVTYTLTVTNTGNLSVSNVAVANPMTAPAGLSSTPVCPSGVLLPGASVTCTASYVVTQADLDQGSILDTPVATATDSSNAPVTSNQAPGTVSVTRAGSLTLTKSASRTSVDAAGQTISYSFLVQNTGNQTVTGLTVADRFASPAGPGAQPVCPASVAPGQSVTCTSTYTTTQADIDKGSVANTAIASGVDGGGNTVASNSSSVTVPANQRFDVYSTQTTDVPTVSKAGDKVVFSFNIINNGNVTVTGGQAIDTLTAPAGPALAISCPTTVSAPGTTVTCTATYTVTQADIDAGSITSTAVFSGTLPDGTRSTSPPIVATVGVVDNPSLTLTKSASPTSVSDVGQTVSYRFDVTNNGNLTVNALSIADTFTAPAGPNPTVSCSTTTLAPGAAATCTAAYSVTQADLDAGSITNSAVASGTTARGTATSPASTAIVTVGAAPALTLAKSASPSTVTAAGQKVTFSFLVTDTGNTSVRGLAIADTLAAPAGPALTGIACPSTTLTPGESTTCSAVYTATQADVDHGSIVNSATASATSGPGTGTPVTSPASTATVAATQTPAVTLREVVTPSPITTAGTVLSYSYTVTNSGNTTLTGLGVSSTYIAPAAATPPTITCDATTLVPTATTTCRATYTTTQADIDKGSVRNSATATGTSPSGATVTAAASGSVTVTRSGALTVLKSASPATVTSANQKITYSFLVTNTGNQTLSNLSVADTAAAPAGPASAVVCPDSTLVPSATTTCTATYSSTQADIDNGSITDTAIASATDTRGNQFTSTGSTATVTAAQTTTLSLTGGPTSPAALTQAGQQVAYTFTVTNTGNVSVTGVGVSQNLTAPGAPNPTISCTPTDLAPGASTTCTGVYTATQDDIDAGRVAGTAIATAAVPAGTAVSSNTVRNSVPVTSTPALTIAETGSPSSVTTVGQTVTFSFLVTNTGNSTVTNLTVDDPLAAPASTTPVVTCLDTTTLRPGESTTCTTTYAVTQADLDKGSIVSTSTASGTTPGTAQVTSAPSGATIRVAQNPALTVVKSATPTTVGNVGDTIGYSFAVSNTGNVTLSTLAVADTFNAPATADITVTCTTTTLLPGATTTCTGTRYTVTQADLDAGGVTNSATASAQTPGGTTVTSDPSAATVAATAAPKLTLSAASTPATVTRAGQTVTITYTVTNTGNVGVNGLATANVFTSPAGPAVTPLCAATTLAPGASTTCSATYQVSQADIDHGSIVATGTATGTSAGGAPVTSNSDSTTIGVRASSTASLAETVAAQTYTAVGDVLTFSYAITNTGTTTLAVTAGSVVASRATGVSCPAGTVAPGATVVCTGTYTVTQADLNAGSVTDSATATLTDPAATTVTTNTVSAKAIAVLQGGLTLTESTTPLTYSAAGQVITYTFTVTNDANETVTGVQVLDSFTGSGTAGLNPPCSPTTLAPKESATCTATYTVTQADVDRGKITDTGTAVGTSGTTTVGSNPVTSSIQATQAPALSATEKVSSPTYATVGQVLTYTETLTNSGNVTLTSPAVADVFTTGSGVAPTFTCTPTTFGPGATSTCTGTYTVTQADLDTGAIVDSATATALAGSTTVTAPTTSTRTTAAQTGSLILAETASTPTITGINQTVTYTYTVVNSSNETITGVGVTDTPNAPAGSTTTPVCTPTTLAPGDSATCTASYTSTQADVDHGSITDSAVATGTDVGGALTSNQTGTTVTVNRSSTATLASTVSSPTYDTVGQVLTFTYTLTNTGTTTLTAATVAGTLDGRPFTATCPTGPVAPGASVTCTTTHTVTQADLEAGSITQTATGTLTASNGTVTTNSTSDTVRAVTTGGLALTESVSTATVPGAGQSITYTFAVTNNTNAAVTGVTVGDVFAAPAGPALTPVCTPTTLAPGAVATCTATYTSTQADADKGSITDTATATASNTRGQTIGSNTTTSRVAVTQQPSIALSETVSSPTYSAVGQVVTYSFTVTNTGNTTVNGTTVSDAIDGTTQSVSCPGTLAPQGTATCRVSHTVTQADLDAGSIVDSATATSTASSGPVTSNTTGRTVTAVVTGSLTLTEAVSTPTFSAVGDQIVYTFTVTNTSNAAVSGVAVSDVFAGPAGPDLTPVCSSTTLAAGASTTCTATYTVTQADLDHGSVVDTATATAPGPNNTVLGSNTTQQTVTAVQAPSLAVTQTADVSSVAAVGDVITYTVTITNTGTVTVTGISGTETTTGTGTVPTVSCPVTSLAPGGSVACTASYTVTQADLDAGSVTASVTTTGTSPTGAAVAAGPSSVTVPVTQTTGLALVKTATPTDSNHDGVVDLGDSIGFSFLLTNTGTVTLTDVGVTDPTAGAVTCPLTTLSPGAQTTCVADTGHTITAADVAAGAVDNTATAHGTAPGPKTVTSPTSTVSTPVAKAPTLQLTGTSGPIVDANGDGVQDAGDTVVYTFTVTNNGTVPLTGLVVTDPRLGTLTCATTTLAAGASTTCTSAPYPLTQGDIDAGGVTTTATATGSTPAGSTVTSNPATVTTPLRLPGLTVVKTATVNDVNNDQVTDAGDTIHYTFAVTNTGNVALQTVAIIDPTAGAVTCAATTLAAGASTTCATVTDHTVTADDVAAGSVTNTASATGTCADATGGAATVAATDGCPTVTSPPTSAVVPTHPTPASAVLSIVKTGTIDKGADGIADVGDVVTWQITVTNDGSGTADNLDVSDPTAGTVTCPVTSLAPGESTTCSVPTHTITAADVAAGKVVNVATAIGSGVAGEVLSSTGGIAKLAVYPPASTPSGSNGHPGTGSTAYTGAGPIGAELLAALLMLGFGLWLLLIGLRPRRRRP